MGTWYIAKPDYSWSASLAEAGITNARLTLRAMGADEFTFSIPGDALGEAALAYGDEIILLYNSTRRFSGTIRTIPRQAVGQRESLTYGAVGGWWWLEQVTYAQSWQMLRAADNELVPVPKPRIVIGQDSSGNRRTLSAEIEAVIDFAHAAGVPITKGTIDAGPMAPLSEHTNMTCAEVILQCLRMMPDRVVWVDHSTTPYPTLHCRAIDNLAAASFDIVTTNAESIDLTPRYDLQVPGIRIVYELSNSWDGHDYSSYSLDSAGDTEDPRCVDLLFELGGSQETFNVQKIETKAYPEAPYTDKAFWVGMFDWLQGIEDEDLSIDEVARSGVEEYARYLTKGSIQDWMTTNFEDETWVVKVSYVRRDGDGIALEKVESKELRITLRSLAASSRTFRKLASFEAAEDIPTGVAAALYASWSRLHWEGSLQVVEQEASFVAGPWAKVNITNGLADWSTMVAAVQEAEITIETGTTRLRLGPSGRLEADALVALFRAVRARRFSWRAPQRADALMGGSEAEGSYQLPREKTSEADPGECRQLRIAAPAGEKKHTIQMDPAAVAHADPTDVDDRTIKAREVWIPQLNGAAPEDQLVLKRCQVMASVPYHADQMLGGLIRLKELLDVTITTPSAWDVIRWDTAASKWVNSSLPGTAMDLSAVRLGYTVAGGTITLRAGKIKMHGKQHISVAQAQFSLGGTQFFYVHHVRSSAAAAWAVAAAEPGVSSTDLDLTYYHFLNGAFVEAHRWGDYDSDLPL